MSIVPASSFGPAGGGAGVAAIKRARGLARKLPDEIGFLDGEVPRPALETAAAEAARLGVAPERILIASGAIDEETFYRRLAFRLGVDFLNGPVALDPASEAGPALAAGVARAADGRLLLAPRGAAITRMLQTLTPGLHGECVAITTPGRLEGWVLATCGPALADDATQSLARVGPGFSARRGASAAQRWVAVVLLATLPYEWTQGLAIWAVVFQAFAAVILISIVLRLVATALALRRTPEPAPPLADPDLPFYSVLVALYRETEVTPRLVAALRSLDYPPAKLEILCLVEADDPATRRALLDADPPSHLRILVVPDGAPRTKPRALNIGLALARGDLIVVFDAEDRPEPDQLRKAAARFAAASPKLACLQAALAIENGCDSWLSALFAIDYAAHFDVLLKGFSALGLPLPLGGSSNHFRAAALRDAGGWDAWNVTEDADLGLRLARLGFRAETLASTTFEEAPPDLRHWFPQRRRWLKGWMQTLLTHTRHPRRLLRELGAARASHAVGLLATNTFGPAIGVWVTLHVLGAAAAGDLTDVTDGLARQALAWSWVGVAALGLVSLAGPTFIGVARRQLWRCAPSLVLRPAHWLCVSAASLAALVELWRAPFHWAKTPHGLMRPPRPAREAPGEA